MAIATGGVVPAGADAVVPVERVVQHDNEVELPNGIEPGTNVRPGGGDVRAGETVVREGNRIGASQVSPRSCPAASGWN